MVDNGTKRERRERKPKGKLGRTRVGGAREWRVEESDGWARDSTTGSEVKNGSTAAPSE